MTPRQQSLREEKGKRGACQMRGHENLRGEQVGATTCLPPATSPSFLNRRMLYSEQVIEEWYLFDCFVVYTAS